MNADSARALLGDLWDDDVAAAVERSPQASAACVRLLKDPPSSIEDGLVGESLAYADLQAGPEFARWLEERGAATPAPSPEPVLVERDGDHLTITLNRPETHNAVDVALRDALVEALELVDADPALTATLRGAGPSFCSGGDLREFGTFPDPGTAHAIRLERLPARALAAVADRVRRASTAIASVPGPSWRRSVTGSSPIRARRSAFPKYPWAWCRARGGRSASPAASGLSDRRGSP